MTDFTTFDFKIPSAFISYFQDLPSGQKPKRKGQTKVYVSTDEWKPEFIEQWRAGHLYVTVKIDGSCCMKKAGQWYRRRDIKKKIVVDGANINEHTYEWELLDGTNPDQINHLAAIVADDNGVVPEYEDGSYELVGSKVQGNRYLYSDDEKVTVNLNITKNGVVTTKTKRWPRQYMIRHGQNIVPLTPDNFEPTLANLTEYIVTNQLEGLVFYPTADAPSTTSYWKVNRGHINSPLKRTDILRFAPRILTLFDQVDESLNALI